MSSHTPKQQQADEEETTEETANCPESGVPRRASEQLSSLSSSLRPQLSIGTRCAPGQIGAYGVIACIATPTASPVFLWCIVVAYARPLLATVRLLV